MIRDEVMEEKYIPTVEDIKSVMDEYPFLDVGSFHTDEYSKLTYMRSMTREESEDELRERMKENRDSMLEEREVKQFQFCCWWFAKLVSWGYVETPNMGSYGLKHIAEKHRGEYISNGMLITAAIFMGLNWRHYGGTNPNVEIAIPKRTLFYKYTMRKLYGENWGRTEVEKKVLNELKMIEEENYEYSPESSIEV